ARRGRWAKIIGDFLGAGEFVPNWPADVLAAAVAQVHAAGGRVAVHAVCPEAIDAAVAAGVDSVEHGWAVTDYHFAAMRARNVVWVPTLMPGVRRPRASSRRQWVSARAPRSGCAMHSTHSLRRWRARRSPSSATVSTPILTGSTAFSRSC